MKNLHFTFYVVILLLSISIEEFQQPCNINVQTAGFGIPHNVIQSKDVKDFIVLYKEAFKKYNRLHDSAKIVGGNLDEYQNIINKLLTATISKHDKQLIEFFKQTKDAIFEWKLKNKTFVLELHNQDKNTFIIAKFK